MVTIRQESSTAPPFLAAYYVSLLLLIIGYFLPSDRTWGINWFYYSPVWLQAALGTIAALGPFLIPNRWLGESPDGTNTARPAKYRIAIITVGLIVWCGICWQVRVETFFLGDGYQILNFLHAGNQNLKLWDSATHALHRVSYFLAGGKTLNQATTGLQLLSIASGLGALAFSFVFSRLQGLTFRAAIILSVGLASSGYALLFFGYIETYPPLACILIVTCLIGVLVANKNCAKWWLVVCLAIAMALHPFGAALAPGATYLLVRDTSMWKAISSKSTAVRFLLSATGLLLVAVALVWLARSSYIVRFLFVPPLHDRFTVEGYTLFSASHLLDIANLYIVLLPSLPLLIVTVAYVPLRRVISQPVYRFLIVTCASAFLISFVFDPKLGMPRDWDLFAFAGIPLAVFWYLLLVDPQLNWRSRTRVACLSCVLGAVFLFSRAAVFADAEPALLVMESYSELDHSKNKNLQYILVQWLRDHGQKARGDSLERDVFKEYPEIKIQERAVALYENGQIEQSVILAKQAIALNPSSIDPYSLLCAVYSSTNQLPQALEYGEISFGLNPRNAAIAYNMANVNARMGKVDEARKYLESALKFEPDHQPSLYGMASIAVANRDVDDLRRWLAKLPVKDSVDASKFGDLVYSACARSMFDEAADLLKFGIAHKLDTAVAAEIVRRYPDLRARLK